MASFLSALNAGARVAEAGVNAYDRAQEWTEKLKEKAYQHETAAKALKTEADRYADTKAEKEKKDKIDAERAAATEKHLAKQDELTDAEIALMKAGKGRYGTGSTRAPQIPPEVKVAMSNRDSARKSISALAAGGIMTPPPELQARLDASEGALARVARKNNFDLGEDAAATEDFHKSLASMQAKASAEADAKAHPVKTWFKHAFGGSDSTSGTSSGADVQTRTLKDGTSVQVRKLPDGTYEQVQ